jgi:hypothetical protein
MSEKQVFESLEDVLSHLDQSAGEINEKTRVYQHQFEELTGVPFGKQLNALDVVRIVNKVFWRENGSSKPDDERHGSDNRTVRHCLDVVSKSEGRDPATGATKPIILKKRKKEAGGSN